MVAFKFFPLFHQKAEVHSTCHLWILTVVEEKGRFVPSGAITLTKHVMFTHCTLQLPFLVYTQLSSFIVQYLTIFPTKKIQSTFSTEKKCYLLTYLPLSCLHTKLFSLSLCSDLRLVSFAPLWSGGAKHQIPRCWGLGWNWVTECSGWQVCCFGTGLRQ